MRSIQVSIFVVMVAGLALAVGVTRPVAPLAEHAGLVFTAALLAAASAVRPARVPGLRLELTACHPFVVFAMAAAGALGAGMAAAAAVLGAAMGGGRPIRPLKLVFNLGSMVLAAFAGHAAFAALSGGLGSAAALAAGTAVYYLANMALVGSVTSLEAGSPPPPAFFKVAGYTALSFLAGLVIALGLLSIPGGNLPWLLALGVPASVVLLAFHRLQASEVSGPAADPSRPVRFPGRA